VQSGAGHDLGHRRHGERGGSEGREWFRRHTHLGPSYQPWPAGK
jgi:hypothetical protein